MSDESMSPQDRRKFVGAALLGAAGGQDFPRPVKDAMTAVSQVMTRSSYWV